MIDLLLGCDTIPDIMLQGHITGPKNAPMAVNTVFGWAILGKYLPQGNHQTLNTINPTGISPLDNLLTRFWHIEEPSSTQSMFTPEEEAVQQHFATTHVYVESPGYYQVSLPKVNDDTVLGLSRPQALNRYLSNERSIQRKGTYEAFQAVVRD